MLAESSSPGPDFGYGDRLPEATIPKKVFALNLKTQISVSFSRRFLPSIVVLSGLRLQGLGFRIESLGTRLTHAISDIDVFDKNMGSEFDSELPPSLWLQEEEFAVPAFEGHWDESKGTKAIGGKKYSPLPP